MLEPMKLWKTSIQILIAISCWAGMGCSEDQDTHFSYVNVPLSSHDVVLSEQDVFDVTIGLPGVNYRVKSDDPEIVTAVVADDVIRLTAGKIGSTMVHLSDDGYNRARMIVTVKQLYDLVLESIPGQTGVLRLDNDGSVKNLKILSGNGGYEAYSSAPESVEASIIQDPESTDGWLLSLKGKSNIEEAEITVRDCKQKSVTIKVSVTDPLAPLVLDVEGEITGTYNYGGELETKEIHILSGNGDYRVESNNPKVASVSLEGETIHLTIVGDGAATLSVYDRMNEQAQVRLSVPMNTDDPTPRISWDDYRADLTIPETVSRGSYATTKHMYWDHGKDSWHVSFNGGWADNLECVNATNRKPLLEVTTDGQTVMYDDKTSEIALTSLYLQKRVGDNGKESHIYYISFQTADGHKGFIVHDWNACDAVK